MVKKAECVDFLRWALPRLHLRWEGFRRVRRQVCHRIQRRVGQLGLADVESYRTYLATHDDEWGWLDAACRIPISRFYRNRGEFDFLSAEILPLLARRAVAAGDDELRCWSAGCASGEEPYSIALIWWLRIKRRFPTLPLRVVATDVDPNLLERARRACYRSSSLKDLPSDWVELAFVRVDELLCLRPELRQSVEFHSQDIRSEAPPERFHLILCRNLAFTYFDEDVQRSVALLLREHLEPGGILVLGSHEKLPQGVEGFPLLEGHSAIYENL
jgi:chemotaxis protein methyltransferase CheR